MTRVRLIFIAHGLDLVTFVAAIGVLGVPIGVESNPLYVATYLAGGLVVVAILKISLAVVMLYLARRLHPNRRAVGVTIASAIGLVGACSNVWTSLIWLQIR